MKESIINKKILIRWLLTNLIILAMVMIVTLISLPSMMVFADSKQDVSQWQSECLKEAQSADHILGPDGDMWTGYSLILPGQTIAIVPECTEVTRDNGKGIFTSKLFQLDNATGSDFYMPDGMKGGKVVFTPVKSGTIPIPYSNWPVVNITGDLNESYNYTKLYRYDGDNPLVVKPNTALDYSTSSTLQGDGYNINEVAVYHAEVDVWSAPCFYSFPTSVDLTYQFMDMNDWSFASGTQLPNKLYCDNQDHTYTFPIPTCMKSGQIFKDWQVAYDSRTLEEVFKDEFYLSDEDIVKTDDSISITLNMNDRITAHGYGGINWNCDFYPSSKYAPDNDPGTPSQGPTGEPHVIGYMDIGNVWTRLSPVDGVAFTTALDRDGALYNQLQIVDQYWKDIATNVEIHDGGNTLPEYGHSYEFYITLKPLEGYSFDDKQFDTFIFEGNTVASADYTKTLNQDGTITMHWGYVKNATANLSRQIASFGATTLTYDGTSKQPSVSIITTDGKILVKDNDYSVYWRNSKGDWLSQAPTDPGNYILWIQGQGQFDNCIYRDYVIIPKTTTIGTPNNANDGIIITWSRNTSATGYRIYRSVNGAAYTSVKTIPSNTTVSWKDTGAKSNGAKYQYKMTAYNTGNGTTLNSAYSSVKTTYFVSRPTISSLKNSSKKKMVVKWGKNSKATGYQLQYSRKSNFSGAKNTTITRKSTVAKTIGKLQKGKTYYVRIRTYKTVGKTKYYSTWSVKKSVKIKK